MSIQQYQEGTFLFSKTTKTDIVDCLLQDRKGNLWIGSSEQGVYRFDGKTFTHFTDKDGITDSHIFSMFEDKTGVIWVGTANGLYKYNGKHFSRIMIPHTYRASEPDAMGNIVYNPDCILSILQDKRGDLWFGSMGFGVYRYDGITFSFFLSSEKHKRNLVQCITEDRNGTLWFGTRGEGVWNYNGTAFRNFQSAIVNNNHILDILEDKNGDLWFSAVGGGVRHYTNRSGTKFTAYDGEMFREITPKEGACFRNVFHMLQDKKGNIWFGSDGGGVCMYNGKSFVNYTVQNGLCNNAVRAILEDNTGNIWFGTRAGKLCRYDGKTFTSFSEYGK